MEDFEGFLRRGLVVLVIRYQTATVIGRQDLRGLEVQAGKRGFPAARRPDLRVFLGYGLELHFVVEPFSDSIRPCTELLAVPLEAVVAMTELTSGKRLELCVVFRVRSREDDSCRSGELK